MSIILYTRLFSRDGFYSESKAKKIAKRLVNTESYKYISKIKSEFNSELSKLIEETSGLPISLVDEKTIVYQLRTKPCNKDSLISIGDTGNGNWHECGVNYNPHKSQYTVGYDDHPVRDLRSGMKLSLNRALDWYRSNKEYPKDTLSELSSLINKYF